MAIKSAQLASEKLGRGISTGGETYRLGVNAVTENPMEKAAQNAQKWVDGVNRSFTEGTYQAGLRAVPFQTWKDRTSGEGAQRWQASAATAQANYKKFADQFFPHLATVQAEVEAMSDLTLEDNIARMVHNARRNATFTYVK